MFFRIEKNPNALVKRQSKLKLRVSYVIELIRKMNFRNVHIFYDSKKYRILGYHGIFLSKNV